MRSRIVAAVLATATFFGACAPGPTEVATARPSASAPAPAGIGGIAVRTVPFANGLEIDVPTSWTLGGTGSLNRGTERYFFAGDRDLEPLPTVYGNGDVDGALLPSGAFVLEIEAFCRLSCQGPQTETPLPPDWSAATPFLPTVAMPADRHQQSVAFRWFDLPMTVIARWADPAPPDVALLPAVVASIRPVVAPPARGEYHGWAAAGALADIAPGGVRLETLPAGAVASPRIYDAVPFFIVRDQDGLYAFVSRPLHDARCVIEYVPASDRFACEIDGRRYEWTRIGRYLGPEPASDLPQHRVIVRDGIVFVRYTSDTLSSAP